MTTINDYDYILINTEFNDNSNNIIYENVVLYDSRLLEYQEELLFCLTERPVVISDLLEKPLSLPICKNLFFLCKII